MADGGVTVHCNFLAIFLLLFLFAFHFGTCFFLFFLFLCSFFVTELQWRRGDEEERVFVCVSRLWEVANWHEILGDFDFDFPFFIFLFLWR